MIPNMTTRLELIREFQSLHVKVPKGWRIVRDDEKIRAGDKYHIRNPDDQWIAVCKDDRRIGMICYPDCYSMHITPIK